eukprot:gnl/TRDRNA2_/TRDRNA2_185188_c0_seq1.p1 gnl/TRDRNA2_/TRDRNA2_185188_c0~~gnl/TRDRNA2_/TRDRNA2_185188_c0_seq1.p1  ORF type:complete len:194 (-),score=56.59 gnl/TRDRNA2_/TRDRNA2_185188_c0_seq1:176-757(-)
MVQLRWRSQTAPSADKPSAGTCDPVHHYVRKALLESLQVKLKEEAPITALDLAALADLDAAADDEVLVPVDLQEGLDQSAKAKNPRGRLEMYLRAMELFKSNPEGAPANSRPQEVTGKEWRESALESDPEDDASCDQEDEEEEEEEVDALEDGEEEGEQDEDDLAEEDDEDEADVVTEEPAAKRQRTAAASSK